MKYIALVIICLIIFSSNGCGDSHLNSKVDLLKRELEFTKQQFESARERHERKITSLTEEVEELRSKLREAERREMLQRHDMDMDQLKRDQLKRESRGK